MPAAPDSQADPSRPSVDRRTMALEIVMVDLVAAHAALAAEEQNRPRLSEEDERRAVTISDEHQRQNWRASRIALRVVLERVGGQSLRRVPIRAEEGGRPVLAEGGPQFSISHTEGFALIAVADSVVGVDLEAVTRKLKMSADRRQRIVSAAARFHDAPRLSASIDADVLTAWVRLEAVAKARGSGIGRLLTEHGVVGGSPSPVPVFSNAEFDLRSLDVGPAHVAAIAARELPERPEVIQFPTKNIEAFLGAKNI
ncbi:phosphopantetheinyl transferase [Hyphomicrobium sp.]|uniref:4'-phosphopantetheinyl transferase family protein n=1 Tax=Hyphomicrobium sp. TaxID=82 RepID=UPI000FA45B11|nr:phosphopantetheinyl transferase [Hyphomicrobium sp.]RUO97984.1 MAG: phosphopantetheinyl transferase [Hyphomicrobium sp.]